MSPALNFGQALLGGKAAALYCGCSQRYLPKVSAGSGATGGLRLTNNGLS